jgi:enterochelin esterase-like enzyme
MVGMKMTHARLVCLAYFAITFLFLSAATLTAQEVKSPEVHTDGSVTFRLVAPTLQKVEVHLDDASGMKRIAMTKDDSGLWSVTTAPLTPDIYSYTLGVEGGQIIDPNVHEYVPNHFGQGGVFTVPGTPAQPWEEADVPHGEVDRHFYTSKVAGDRRDFYVYTPPGFEAKGKKKYPVLYLLHGYSDMANAWTAMGHANFILDNLIAQRKAKPMIVVMPLGYGAPKLLDSGWNIGHNELWRTNIDRFADALLTEVLPQVEKDYPVIKDRNSRAIAGLSMGGAETLYTGLNHLDQFAWMGPLSSAIFDDPAKEFPGLDANHAAKIKLLWIACGKEDGLLKANREFKAWLTSKNVKFTDVETDGAHTWPVWRRNLVEFAPLLFR